MKDGTSDSAPQDTVQEALSRADEPRTGDDEELARVLASLRRQVRAPEPGCGTWLRGLSSWSTRARKRALLAVVLTTTSLAGTLWLRPDLPAAWNPRTLLALAVWAGLLWPLLSQAQRPWHAPSLSPGATWAWVGSAWASAVWLASLPASHHHPPWTELAAGASLWDHAPPCLMFGLALGLPVYVASRVFEQRAVHTPWLAVAAAGIAGNLALLLHCPITDPLHLLAGHASVCVAAVLFLLWGPHRLMA